MQEGTFGATGERLNCELALALGTLPELIRRHPLCEGIILPSSDKARA
jgi:hypothetical protein